MSELQICIVRTSTITQTKTFGANAQYRGVGIEKGIHDSVYHCLLHLISLLLLLTLQSRLHSLHIMLHTGQGAANGGHTLENTHRNKNSIRPSGFWIVHGRQMKNEKQQY